MKKYLLILVLILPVLLLTGCLPSTKKSNNNSNNNQSAPVAKNDNSQSANINKTPQKFYPEQSNINKSTPANPGSQFVVTQELELKFYLVDKYQPGVCYGLPGPVSEAAVQGMIERNPELSLLVRQKYNLQTDLDIYNKIKQLNGIQLTELAGGKYQFNLTDGQCCTLTAYEGEVTIIGKTISDQLLRQETQENPC